MALLAGEDEAAWNPGVIAPVIVSQPVPGERWPPVGIFANCLYQVCTHRILCEITDICLACHTRMTLCRCMAAVQVVHATPIQWQIWPPSSAAQSVISRRVIE